MTPELILLIVLTVVGVGVACLVAAEDAELRFRADVDRDLRPSSRSGEEAGVAGPGVARDPGKSAGRVCGTAGDFSPP